MKAAYLTGPQQVELREVPIPAVPDDGLLLQVKSSGICGSDIRRWREGPAAGTEPMIPGHEASGVVAEVGRNGKRFAAGDRIAIAPDIHCGVCYYCQRGKYNLCDSLRFLGITPGYPGALAEYMVLTGEALENGIVHKMPEGMEFPPAAIAEPCCSVLSVYNKNIIGLNDTLVVLGAGPIGCLFVALAKTRGARVIVSQPGDTRRQMVERFEPYAILNPDTENVVQRVKEMTGGLGADVVVCANPVAATQTQAVEMVRKGGKVVLFGGLPKSKPMTSLDSNRIHYGEIEIVGAFSYHPTIHQLALDLLHRGIIPAGLLITHTFSIDDIDRAFAVAGGEQGLKVLINL